MTSLTNKPWRTALMIGYILGMLTVSAQADKKNGYTQINLVSDVAGVARFQDERLVNAWGLVIGPEGKLIVADNGTGLGTFYKENGRPFDFTINVPAPDGGPGAPTGLVLNDNERSFIVCSGRRHAESILIFATEEGTLAAWNPDVDKKDALIVVNHSADGAIYKGLAIAQTSHGPRLYTANFGVGVVEIYNKDWERVRTFTDPGLSQASFVPFGIEVIRDKLFVTYAFKASPGDTDETAGPGLGYVVEFDLNGDFVRRFASQGPLNAPWGLALAPREFGKFGGALMVGNFGDGRINAYNLKTGAFLGQLTEPSGDPICIDGLWGLAFGEEDDELYFTAGPNDEENGLLGALKAIGSGRGKDDKDD
ncbi:MAG: hypothetical protein JWM16_2677 [Verrucomicrobiales bacterium]|nr:hypothetical protein [Verrucomicrobiales bacterium]